jgi:hypothetical protein
MPLRRRQRRPRSPVQLICEVVEMLMHINDARRSPENKVLCKERESAMKQISLKRLLLAASVVAFGVTGSIDWSQQGGLSFSVESAQARVGRPLTPVSVAGVARRTTRRAVVGGAAVGAAVVGTPACVRVLVNGAYVCR